MTTNYTYKTGRNNASFNNMNSKKGTYAIADNQLQVQRISWKNHFPSSIL